MVRVCSLVPLLVLAACSSRPVEEVRAEEAASYREQADAEAQSGNHAAAFDLYSEAIKLNPSSAETFFRRGNMCVKMSPDHAPSGTKRDWIRQAVFDYSKAIELNPVFTTAMFNRAMVYMKMKQYRPATLDLNEIVTLEKGNTSNPMLKDALLYLGEVLLTKFEDEQIRAMSHYEAYVALGGDRPDIVKKVREWREVKESIARENAGPAPKGPTADDEAAAKQLHSRILALIPKGEEQKPEIAKLLEELMTKHGHTKYVRDNEKGLKALQNAFRPKEK
jgi:tetratricopeptide (TPR) repeat protein